MSMYLENKFKELSLQRKAQVCLDLIYKIDRDWENQNTRIENLSLLKSYFSWFNQEECNDKSLKKIIQGKENLKAEITERGLLDFTVPLERFLSQSLKDDQILKITFKDDLNKARKLRPIYLVLDHLRSSFNVGSIFRMAECLGVSHIYLVGYTPTPKDAGVIKTAMGTQEIVSWSSHHFMKDVINELRLKKIKMIGLETLEGAKNIQDLSVSGDVALFVGNERFGISEDTISQLDECAIIPMMGVKNSLNVANSLSIATFEMARKLQ